ncbi:UMP kinase [Mycoplasmoides pirum]|uniref:UMP kinase n=1 Tax=Mycoplasmoides pirum TaxID=2122 RepID=UPI00047FE58B|nr:UMP kinase [Mycoplasmoides pirum]
MKKTRKTRILIKISGSSLQNPNTTDTFDLKRLDNLCKQIAILHKKYEIGIVVGGGNIWRGKLSKDLRMDQRRADYIGMVATIINASLIDTQLDVYNVKSCVLSSIPCPHLTNIITPDNIDNAFSENKVVIFAGGIGAPFFTTDTGAALRAIEINAKLILVGKDGVDGVYSSDPKKNPNAKFYSKLTFKQALKEKLSIMDLTSFTMCQENDIELIIFNIEKPNSIINAISGKIKRTLVSTN